MDTKAWSVVLGPAGTWGVKDGSGSFVPCGTRSRALQAAVRNARNHRDVPECRVVIRIQRPDGTWERERLPSEFAGEVPTPISPTLAAAG